MESFGGNIKYKTLYIILLSDIIMDRIYIAYFLHSKRLL